MKQFTRDEAIAIVKAHRGVDAVLTVVPMTNARREFIAGLRVALEALAAAGVFVPDDVTGCDDSCASGKPCPKSQTMADKLDAAGIR